jgi:hypothetical protein
VRLQGERQQAILRRHPQEYLIAGCALGFVSSGRRPHLLARGWVALWVVLGVATLSACSTVSSWLPFSSSSKTPPAAACPTAVILHPLSQTAVFAPGAEHQPLGVAFYGILDDVSSKCDRSGDSLRASLNVVVIGERGPAGLAAGTGIDLQYFVAVTGPNQTVLSKRSLPVHIAIPAGVRRAGVTDHIVEVIPLAGRAPGDLGIVLGFQQTPDVVEFYKHFRGR